MTLPNPEHYSLTFDEDGALEAVLDCNDVSGTYLSGESGELTMGLGPATMADYFRMLEVSVIDLSEGEADQRVATGVVTAPAGIYRWPT